MVDCDHFWYLSYKQDSYICHKCSAFLTAQHYQDLAQRPAFTQLRLESITRLYQMSSEKRLAQALE